MGRPSITAMEAAIPEASGMIMIIRKTFGKIIRIGMKMRTKRGMSGRMVRRLFYGSATSKRTVIRLGRRR